MAPSTVTEVPPPPAVSIKTLHIAGILVDIHGLAEVPPTATQISVLWLHHPRTRSKEQMNDIAARAVSAWNASAPKSSTRGLIAAAFDQRNHGSRQVLKLANEAWRGGNPTHAQDMFGVVTGTVADTRGLIDLLPGYLFHEDGEAARTIDQHLVLGWSLGGHSCWQLMFADPRVTAGVSVIGCPDFMYLMADRARLSKLSTYKAEDEGKSFIGSKDFPPAVVAKCEKLDPKGILFGTGKVPSPPISAREQERLRPLLDSQVKGKRFLLCSGGDDKLVPYRCTKPFVDFLKDATETWYSDGGLSIEDNVYPGRGHVFSPDMITDAVRFIVDAVGDPELIRNGTSAGKKSPSKI